MNNYNKNLLAILLFLSGAASVVAVLASSLDPTVASVLRQGGPLLFVATLAWTLRMGVSRLEMIEQNQQRLLKDVEDFSKAERHGHAIQDLQSLSEVMDQAGTIHAASKVFLNIATKEVPVAADSISAYQKGGELHISENFVISNVLARLAENLPDRCIWLGTSRLVSGWDVAADPAFREFTNHLDRLAAEQKIRIFRVFCIRENDRDHILKVVNGARGGGSMARVLSIGDDDIPDISLILELKKGVRLEDCDDPRYVLANSNGIYGMQFEIVGGALVQRVRFVGPKTNSFQRLVTVFNDSWNRAEDHSARGPQDAAA
jgi:hypothetical protein